MSIDAMKQALAALEGWANHGEWVWPESALEQAKRNTTESITALRAAIEQAQGKHEDWCASLTQLLLSMPPKPAPCNCKPRTAPPRQWQGLTDEELWELWNSHTEQPFPEWFVDFKQAYKVIAEKLKEKNT